MARMERHECRDAGRNSTREERPNLTITFAHGTCVDRHIRAAPHPVNEDRAILRIGLDGQDPPSIVSESEQGAPEMGADIHKHPWAIGAHNGMDDLDFIERLTSCPLHRPPESVRYSWRKRSESPLRD